MFSRTIPALAAPRPCAAPCWPFSPIRHCRPITPIRRSGAPSRSSARARCTERRCHAEGDPLHLGIAALRLDTAGRNTAAESLPRRDEQPCRFPLHGAASAVSRRNEAAVFITEEQKRELLKGYSPASITQSRPSG